MRSPLRQPALRADLIQQATAPSRTTTRSEDLLPRLAEASSARRQHAADESRHLAPSHRLVQEGASGVRTGRRRLSGPVHAMISMQGAKSVQRSELHKLDLKRQSQSGMEHRAAIVRPIRPRSGQGGARSRRSHIVRRNKTDMQDHGSMANFAIPARLMHRSLRPYMSPLFPAHFPSPRRTLVRAATPSAVGLQVPAAFPRAKALRQCQTQPAAARRGTKILHAQYLGQVVADIWRPARSTSNGVLRSAEDCWLASNQSAAASAQSRKSRQRLRFINTSRSSEPVWNTFELAV